MFFFFSSRRRHTRYWRDWSSDVCSSDLISAFAVLGFLALRFALASVALSPILLSGITRRALLVGGGIGLVLAMGYLFQTFGLLYTTPTNSGLITGLFVVFAPLADRIFLDR